jgi:hypothetical protein
MTAERSVPRSAAALEVRRPAAETDAKSIEAASASLGWQTQTYCARHCILRHTPRANSSISPPHFLSATRKCDWANETFGPFGVIGPDFCAKPAGRPHLDRIDLNRPPKRMRLFNRITASDGGKTVDHLIPRFQRSSEDHDRLRKPS